MSNPYVVSDGDGNYLTVTPTGHGTGVDMTVTDAKSRTRTAMTVPAWKLPDLVAAMFRHAGYPVPVLINPNEVAEDWVRVTRNGGAA